MNAAEYRDYLTSDHWRRTRRDALESRGHHCEACQSRHAIHVHHRSYARLHHERLDDLRVLCDHCHQLVHDTERQHRVPLAEATDLVTAATAVEAADDGEPIQLGRILPTVVRQLIVRADTAASLFGGDP